MAWTDIFNDSKFVRTTIVTWTLLYTALFLMLYYVKLEDSTSSTSTAEQTTLPSTPSLSKPLSKKARDSIFVLSAFIFIVAYFWQMIGIINSETVTSIDFTMFLMPMLYSLVFSAIVGITGYLMAKISNSSISPMNNESYERRTFIRLETPKKSEEQNWYQQALKQHQIDVTEDTSKQTEDLENLEPENSQN